jgi:hypothetical protein
METFLLESCVISRTGIQPHLQDQELCSLAWLLPRKSKSYPQKIACLPLKNNMLDLRDQSQISGKICKQSKI